MSGEVGQRMTPVAPRLAPSRLAGIEAFRHLTAVEQGEIERTCRMLSIARGETLVRQGEPAAALYLVVSGRFVVRRDSQSGEPAQLLAEIGTGMPIGEIAFFSGGQRTATVTAERDSLVLVLERDDFDRLAMRSPQIWRTITATLADRLAAAIARSARPAQAMPRTIAVCGADGHIDAGFLDDLRSALARQGRVTMLDATSIRSELKRPAAIDSSETTEWLNKLEARFDHVVYVTDPEPTEWSRKALRQADLVLCVARRGSGQPSTPGANEQFARNLHKDLHGAGMIRLVLLHEHGPPYHRTRAWLDARPWVSTHHHVRTGFKSDCDRLVRFIRGQALGLVACGGGAFCATHIGCFEALAAHGLVFDAVGGTSGGAAMVAALAFGITPDEIARRTHDIFVARKAMRRWTWPRYSLLDHAAFDAALAEHFTSTDIADLAIPFFAVATNLTRNATHCLRRGPVWEAIRASAAIPALLPPVFTDDGEMLVDGCLMENVPLKTMRSIKTGPNVVIDFRVPPAPRRTARPDALPARRELIWRLATGLGGTLPDQPPPHAVLMQALMLNQHDYAAEMGADDILLAPVMPAAIGHLDWHRHDELRRLGRDFANSELDRLRDSGHPLLCAAPADDAGPIG